MDISGVCLEDIHRFRFDWDCRLFAQSSLLWHWLTVFLFYQTKFLIICFYQRRVDLLVVNFCLIDSVLLLSLIDLIRLQHLSLVSATDRLVCSLIHFVQPMNITIAAKAIQYLSESFICFILFPVRLGLHIIDIQQSVFLTCAIVLVVIL